jgi:hypothetical protein
MGEQTDSCGLATWRTPEGGESSLQFAREHWDPSDCEIGGPAAGRVVVASHRIADNGNDEWIQTH